MYTRVNLSDSERSEVIRGQREKVGDWQVGRLRALLVSTASAEDRQQIERAIAFQDGRA